MAKKTPKKFRQARKDAKAEAKKAFAGKKKAVLKDPTVKYSADDQKILREVSQEAKRGYITTDTGERVYSKPTETAKERIARERAEAMRKYREQIAEEDGEKPKKKPAKKAAVKKGTAGTTKKPDAKGVSKIVEEAKARQSVAKPKVKKPTRAEKSAANKAAWKKMTPEQRKNWSANKPMASAVPAKDSLLRKSLGISTEKWSKMTQVEKEAAVKKSGAAATAKEKARLAKDKETIKARQAARAAKTPVYSITDVQPEKASKGAKKAKFVQKKTKADVAKTKTAAPKTGGTVAIRPKGTVATTGSKPKPKAATAGAAKKTSKLAKFGRKFAVGAAATAAGAELVSLAKGSIYRDVKEIDRLEKKLAKAQGKKSPDATALGRLNQLRKQTAGNLANFADLATFGAVGQTRRERMDELNRLIKKEKKKTAKPSSTKTPPVKGPLAPSAGAAGAASGAGSAGAASGKGGGSKPATTPGSTYVVKRGDTLSGIAKSAGVSLAEIRAANKKFAKNPKYKQGNMIWAGTTVKIPKKK